MEKSKSPLVEQRLASSGRAFPLAWLTFSIYEATPAFVFHLAGSLASLEGNVPLQNPCINESNDTLERPNEFTKLYAPCAATKLALSLWSYEIASKVAGEGLKILSVDPGANNTIRKGKRSGIPFYLKPIIKLFFPQPSKGAALLYDADMLTNKAVSGSFLVNGRVTELKFIEQSRKVLEKVSSIYMKEFSAAASPEII
ncbi:hypothetical protein [Paenibacillus sp. LHD-38]|uniref:hypothetical protein n=1 Tax=Paenibacillus sp. LHD-38 TaxID=3072143 RepID=UPI00280CB42C|nr:hypothetical protein [Paenibacillus sp. LHD-38]MDQ8737344.1 hypothetical protein [Paenibacillus sp. LHD-38]